MNCIKLECIVIKVLLGFSVTNEMESIQIIMKLKSVIFFLNHKTILFIILI